MSYTLTTDQIREIENRMDLDVDTEVRFDYSGRGMFGRTCLGYTGGAATEFIALVALSICEAENDDDAWSLIEKLSDIGEAETDSMGTGRIVYWRSITIEESDEED